MQDNNMLMINDEESMFNKLVFILKNIGELNAIF